MTRFGLAGNSPPMKRLRQKLDTLARSTAPDLTVLFVGETGTGKSMVARALHKQGARKNRPFVPVNCAAIPATLFGSQMFGHVKGAFTGAAADQPGFFEQAQGGTLFLDEIGELPLEQQAALLHPLGDTRLYRRIGGKKDKTVDFHLFCATTKDLNEATKRGEFRSELLRRLKVNVCRIPPLRERGPEDIDLLAGLFIARAIDPTPRKAQGGQAQAWVNPQKYLTRDARDFLYTYDWPYNVGEMENVFRNERIRQVILAGTHRVDRELIEDALDQAPGPVTIPLPRRTGPPSGLTYKQLLQWWEQTKRSYILEVYERHGRNKSATAEALECGRDTVYKYLPSGDG